MRARLSAGTSPASLANEHAREPDGAKPDNGNRCDVAESVRRVANEADQADPEEEESKDLTQPQHDRAVGARCPIDTLTQRKLLVRALEAAALKMCPCRVQSRKHKDHGNPAGNTLPKSGDNNAQGQNDHIDLVVDPQVTAKPLEVRVRVNGVTAAEHPPGKKTLRPSGVILSPLFARTSK